MTFPPWLPSPRGAFSLVEVTLALGVISFALVGIMAMFPVAMKTANDSNFETRALFIAQGILADLQSGSNPQARALSLMGDTSGIPVDLQSQGEWFFALNEEGQPQEIASSGAWANGAPSPASTYLARVAVYPNPADLSPLVSQVEVTVSAPSAAPLIRRTQYAFATLVQTQ
jgi:uncharacterized protein (TIGR02598 family)